MESPDPRAMGMFDCSLHQFISAGSSRTQIRKPFFPLDLSKAFSCLPGQPGGAGEECFVPRKLRGLGNMHLHLLSPGEI